MANDMACGFGWEPYQSITRPLNLAYSPAPGEIKRWIKEALRELAAEKRIAPEDALEVLKAIE